MESFIDAAFWTIGLAAVVYGVVYGSMILWTTFVTNRNEAKDDLAVQIEGLIDVVEAINERIESLQHEIDVLTDDVNDRLASRKKR